MWTYFSRSICLFEQDITWISLPYICCKNQKLAIWKLQVTYRNVLLQILKCNFSHYMLLTYVSHFLGNMDFVHVVTPYHPSPFLFHFYLRFWHKNLYESVKSPSDVKCESWVNFGLILKRWAFHSLFFFSPCQTSFLFRLHLFKFACMKICCVGLLEAAKRGPFIDTPLDNTASNVV